MTVARPVLAATPCYAESCDGKSPFDATITSGCGSFVPYLQAGSEDRAIITLRYSKTCRAAYLEMVFEPLPNTPQALGMFYTPQYSSRAKVRNDVVSASSTVSASRLVSWDYSIKGCYYWSPVGSLTDLDPDGKNIYDTAGFCTPWS
ncbi:DUF2690 domain-containing protein [Actinoplanes solisilvae]|uniref:DUF2690 domain-containing protein n=1 Tax=Actinoplanes solisilvae TaxID=2486853 RepID=UPI0013E2C2E1|nr:DUF2690 domain-containing protein [Actinoplanes solisilvae]